MALEQKLHLKLSQKLIMTPSLQQAIKLLQLSKLELQEVLNQELLENPLLEETAEEVKADHAARARREEAAGAPTHCPAGHRFSDSWQGNWGQRLCQTCATLRAKAFPSPSRDLAYVRAYDRAQRARSRVLAGLPPNPVDCIDCGTPLGVKSGPGPKPTRCASCARLAQLAAQRTYNRRRRRKTAAA